MGMNFEKIISQVKRFYFWLVYLCPKYNIWCPCIEGETGFGDVL